MFKGYNSATPPVESKWQDRNITPIRPEESIIALSTEVKKNTETAASYSRYYHDGKHDELVKLLHPTCQFGTFFGFVWGPTAVKIALMEETKMNLRFIGKLLTYSSHHENTFWKEKKNMGVSSGNPLEIQKAWFAPTREGLHRGPGAPAFSRVTENVFERDGEAKRNHRPFPYNVWDKMQTLKVRETIVVEDGLVTSRVLQNLTSWFPLPYDFM